MAMETVDVHDAQARLTELVPLVMAGTEVVLTDGGTPVVRLVPILGSRAETRQAGLHVGAIEMSADFNEPLPDDFWTGAARSCCSTHRPLSGGIAIPVNFPLRLSPRASIRRML